MTLFSDLEKDVLAGTNMLNGEVQVKQIVEMLCNLIDAKFEKFEQNLARYSGMKETHNKNYGPQKD